MLSEIFVKFVWLYDGNLSDVWWKFVGYMMEINLLYAWLMATLTVYSLTRAFLRVLPQFHSATPQLCTASYCVRREDVHSRMQLANLKFQTPLITVHCSIWIQDTWRNNTDFHGSNMMGILVVRGLTAAGYFFSFQVGRKKYWHCHRTFYDHHDDHSELPKLYDTIIACNPH